MERLVYFDNAATTYPKPSTVYERMDYVNRNLCFNAGRGTYKGAQSAAEIITETRKLMADLVKINKWEYVIFTPSATLALNAVIGGLIWDEPKNVYVTPFEHNSVLRPLNSIAKKGKARLFVLPFEKESFKFDEDAAKSLFEKYEPNYVFLTHISNVTGFILPVGEIVKLTKKFGAVVILDAAQSLGLIEVNINELDVDIAVFAGHKNLYGPFGIGGFIVNPRSDVIKFLEPAFFGGTGSESLKLNMPENIPERFEAGSHNIVAIAGLNAALKWVKENKEDINSKKRKLTSKLVKGLKDLNVRLYVPENLERHLGIVSINLDGYRPEEVSYILDRKFNIATRAGYHCAAFAHEFLGTVETGGTLRISLGFFNEEEEIEYFLSSLDAIVHY